MCKEWQEFGAYRGSAEAVLGPASSPPTSAIGLLRSPEQVAYLFPVSVSQPTNGFDLLEAGRNFAKAGRNYVTGQE